jgi:hypothetical protein
VRFNTGTCTRLLVDLTLDFDPTGWTVEVQVDSDWLAAEWLDTPVSRVVAQRDGGSRTIWTQTARTIRPVAGPTSGSALADRLDVARGRHLTRTRLSLAGETITADSTPLDV